MKIPEFIFKPNSISHKILMAIFFISSMVTLFISCIQLSFNYTQEINSLKKNIDLVEKSYAKNIESSLWQLRLPDLETQLNGILSVPGIKSVSIVDRGKMIAKAGLFVEGETIEKKIPIVHFDDNKKQYPIGELIVIADVEQVKNKLLQEVISIFIIQFAKTLLASILIYLSIQYLLTDHLRDISSYLKKLQLNPFDRELSLKRKNSLIDSEDELDNLVYSINEMRAKINHSYNELTQLNKELEEKVESKTQLIIEQRSRLEFSAKMSTLGEMAGGIAHEINNPITVISSINRIMRKSMEKGIIDQEVYIKCYDDIDKTIIRISKIISGLKIVSRDGSNEEFQLEKTYDIFNDIMVLCAEKFKNQRVELKINLDDPAYQTILNCSRVQLSQVFLNLLNNSYDAIEDLPEKWIRVDCENDDGRLILRFSDSGPGIAKDLQEKIFQPFFTTKVIGKGTGLGLSISNSIVKAHNGDFTIDNTSKNTCFVIVLPIRALGVKCA